MIVLGADPGTIRFGWGVIDTETMGMVDLGVILPPKKVEIKKRLAFIALALKDIFERFHPDEAAVEGQFIGNNAKTGLAIGTAKGVLVGIASIFGVSVAEYTATAVKKEASGKGGAKKGDMIRAMRRVFYLPADPEEDAADALAVALTHARLRDA